MNAVEKSPEVVAALAALDEACEQVAQKLQAAADLVNKGELDGDEVMLRIHGLAARLMS